jgi:hypothetical protein
MCSVFADKNSKQCIFIRTKPEARNLCSVFMSSHSCNEKKPTFENDIEMSGPIEVVAQFASNTVKNWILFIWWF